jgi:hypothetical protein
MENSIMSVASGMVEVTVVGGPSASVAWQSGMTALRALELAQAQIEPDPNEQFTFCLQYYGDALGYLVNMINETYDSFISRGGEKATPFFYWHFFINDTPATKSVDRSILDDGDIIRFSFEQFVAVSHGNTLLAVKHRQNTR